VTEEQRQLHLLLKNDLPHYARKCLKIRPKDGPIQPFIFNKAQIYAHKLLEEQKGRTGKVRALILKGRQQGMSTYIGARYYHQTTHNFGIKTFILTHELEATNNLYEMAKRYYEHTPDLVRPMVSTNNSKELKFGGLDSGYKLGTAENKSVGRSSTIQRFHGSEVAFWANAAEHAKGIMQAVPDAQGTEIILESTANGVGNYFHQQWQQAEAGLTDFQAIFIPWFWQEEYSREAPEDFVLDAEEQDLQEVYGLTNEQLCWRRYKIQALVVTGQDGVKAFKQEYPCNANEAFQLTGDNSYIDSAVVARCRKGKADRYGPLLIGCDPARFGDDRTSIIIRQGRVAFGLQSYVKKDTMEIVGILNNLILQHQPAKVFVDVGGLGAGIVDRLCEVGHRKIVVPVNAANATLYPVKYHRKRDEMWGECKAWLEDEPCQLPDSDTLHADLCGIRFRYNSNSALVMEGKDDMKKRGVRSPDEAEALIQTFALPPEAFEPKGSTSLVKELARDFANKSDARTNSWR
jgi:hypothetical protein